MAKLWAKGYELDKTVETFTVGEDYIIPLLSFFQARARRLAR